MNILLTPTLKLTSDQHNIILNELVQPSVKAKSQEPYWKPVGFYPSLSAAVDRLLERPIRESEAVTLLELKSDLAEFSYQILNQLKDR